MGIGFTSGNPKKIFFIFLRYSNYTNSLYGSKLTQVDLVVTRLGIKLVRNSNFEPKTHLIARSVPICYCTVYHVMTRSWNMLLIYNYTYMTCGMIAIALYYHQINLNWFNLNSFKHKTLAISPNDINECLISLIIVYFGAIRLVELCACWKKQSILNRV